MTTSTPKTGWGSLTKLGKVGLITQGFGALQGGIGAFYQASAEKYRTKSLALSLEHQKDMALFNMRLTESQAWHLNRAYNKQLQIATIKSGNVKSKAKTSLAARGITLGVGSTKDALVSHEIMATLDKLTINSNKVRAVENKRLEGVGLGIKADMLGISADNMFNTASNIKPWMNMGSSLLTSTGTIISSLPSNLLTNE
tara:strand:+ start:2038 stop:2634 length:597 start_codon:yes stop_codon:yes gene_type:complete